MKEGRKPEHPEKTPGDELSENATYNSPKIQAPSETRSRAVALVAGQESRHANRYTTRRLSFLVRICSLDWIFSRFEMNELVDRGHDSRDLSSYRSVASRPTHRGLIPLQNQRAASALGCEDMDG